jgi:hypothetical protein
MQQVLMCDVLADASREPDAKSFNQEIRGSKTPAIDRWREKLALAVPVSSSTFWHAIFGLGTIYSARQRNTSAK